MALAPVSKSGSEISAKHTFRWPGTWFVQDQPLSCVTLRYGEPGKVGSWFSGQPHAVVILPCGCAVCIFCGNLLMLDTRSRQRGGHGWWVFKNDWLDAPLAIECGMRLKPEFFPYVYAWNRMGRKGRRCRVFVRGKMNSCAVEFEDGFRAVTSRNALRRAK